MCVGGGGGRAYICVYVHACMRACVRMCVSSFVGKDQILESSKSIKKTRKLV